MQIIPQYIPAKLQALPTEGLEEYVYWADHYRNIYDRNVKILDIPILDDIAWEIKSRSLLAKYLRD